MKKILLLAFLMLTIHAIYAQPQLVKDINAVPGLASDEPSNFYSGSKYLYFSINSSGKGRELWKTDGTVGGSVLIKDIYPGEGSSNPRPLMEVGNILYFTAVSPDAGNELWKTDGTPRGTVLVKDLAPGSASSEMNFYTHGNGTFYFQLNNSTKGSLWKSDGTAEGTLKLKDFSSGSYPFYTELVFMQGNIYWGGTDGIDTALWKSDGTTEGTMIVKEIDIYPHNTYFDKKIITVNNTVFFIGDGGDGYELWKSDGTTGGTVQVKDIDPSGNGHPKDFLDANGVLYFTAHDGVHGDELWKSDGTEQGTQLVKDVRTGEYGSDIYRLYYWNGKVYFNPYSEVSGIELWSTDGTEEGTMLIRDIYSERGESRPDNFKGLDDGLYFTAIENYDEGRDLWKTDGTEAGTVLVKKASPGINNWQLNIESFKGEIYFNSEEEGSGNELWKVDSVNKTPSLFIDINKNSTGSSIAGITVIDGKMLFSANDGIAGSELWKTDGTESGTVLIKDVSAGTAPSSPKNLISYNGKLIFSAEEASTGREIYISDGTAAGTKLLKDIYPGTESGISEKSDWVEYNGFIYFIATDGVYGEELWQTDGTVDGTKMVKDIRPGVEGSDLLDFKVNGTGLFFSANDGNTGDELWKTDGTEAGTTLVKDIYPGSSSSLDGKSIFLGETNLYLWADDGVSGRELWKSDGTEVGTVLVKDLGPGNSYTFIWPDGRDIDGKFLFLVVSSSDPNVNVGLWSTDGTEAGTVFLKEMGSDFPLPSAFIKYNNEMYIANSFDWLLWKSDGTPEGTVLIKENIQISEMLEVNGKLNFVGFGDLWESDGTAEGTVLLEGFDPGFGTISNLTNVNGSLYFVVNDGNYGSELWRYNPCSLGSDLIVGGSTACQGIEATVSIDNTDSTVSYQAYWEGSSLGEPVKGGGNTVLTLPTENLTVGDNLISIKAIKRGCFADLTNQATITVKPGASLPIVSSEPVCVGEKVTVSLSGADLNQYKIYSQASGGEGVLVAGNEFVTSELTNSDTLYISGLSADCESKRSVINLVVTPFPDKPSIEIQSNPSAIALESSSETGNQWFFNGEPIEGATNQTYETIEPGNYSVSVTVDNCTSISDVANVTSNEEIVNKAFKVYPNPSFDVVYIETNNHSLNDFAPVILNSIGKKVKQGIFTKNGVGLKADILVKDLSPGIYFVKVLSGEKVLIQKFVKK